MLGRPTTQDREMLREGLRECPFFSILLTAWLDRGWQIDRGAAAQRELINLNQIVEELRAPS